MWAENPVFEDATEGIYGSSPTVGRRVWSKPNDTFKGNLRQLSIKEGLDSKDPDEQSISELFIVLQRSMSSENHDVEVPPIEEEEVLFVPLNTTDEIQCEKAASLHKKMHSRLGLPESLGQLVSFIKMPFYKSKSSFYSCTICDGGLQSIHSSPCCGGFVSRDSSRAFESMDGTDDDDIFRARNSMSNHNPLYASSSSVKVNPLFENESPSEGIPFNMPAQAPLEKLFGTPLLLPGEDSSEAHIVLKKCLAEVMDRGLQTEYIYQSAGENSLVDRVRYLLCKEHKNASLDESNVSDVLAITTCLKEFLYELPSPLCTHGLYDDWIVASKKNNEDELISCLSSIIHRLPPANRSSLSFLIHHLAEVTRYSLINHASADDLGKVFGSLLLQCGDHDASLRNIHDKDTQEKVITSLVKLCMKLSW